MAHKNFRGERLRRGNRSFELKTKSGNYSPPAEAKHNQGTKWGSPTVARRGFYDKSKKITYFWGWNYAATTKAPLSKKS